MSKPSKPFSLTQHFEAPEDFTGTFGWLCGYSADAGFLNTALERFTGQTQGRRAASGVIHIAGFLDPGQAQILPATVPGFLHAPLVSMARRPFRLMHAKVALLGFRGVTDPSSWQLRLIVSTGNWTRQTVEDSLDLAWVMNLSSADLKPASESNALLRADISAALDFFGFLRPLFDVSALSATTPGHPENSTTRAFSEFEAWCGRVKRPRVPPRFFDNRKSSLLAQLPKQVRATGIKGEANYLAMASGYFEGHADAAQPPSVLSKIVASLKERDANEEPAMLLKPKAEIDVYVNPQACQSVAACADSMARQRWTVRAPGQPAYFGKEPKRTLHAKFIFAATFKTGDLRCHNAWLYLGSGNLTAPGFTEKASTRGGNLEAGVVFATAGLFYESGSGIAESAVLTNLLPLQWTTPLEARKMQAGGEMPERPAPFVAPPMSWCRWEPASPLGRLHGLAHTDVAFKVLDLAGQACAQAEAGVFVWPDAERPRQVELSWTDGDRECRANVPVLDEFGRFAGTPLCELDMAAAWWQLDSFPLAADEEDDPEGESPEGKDGQGKAKGNNKGDHAARHPIRNLMTLVENIANKQTAIAPADWSNWCSRLEQTLMQAAKSADVRGFDELKLNPLSPLWEKPFRPSFAETAHSDEGERYEQVLRDVQVAWGVDQAERIGAAR